MQRDIPIPDYERYVLETILGPGNTRYDTVLPLVYDRESNTFYNSCGRVIPNVFEHITPGDLLLYRTRPTKYRCFPHRRESRVLCRILLAEEAFEATNGFPPCPEDARDMCWATRDERDAFAFPDLPCNLCQGSYN